MATGFLVECTSPPLDVDRVERTLRDARLQAGPAAPPVYARAWEIVWHDLDEEVPGPAPVSERAPPAPGDAAGRRARKDDIQTLGRMGRSSTRCSGAARATPRISIELMRTLVQGLEQLGHAEAVEVAPRARARLERRAERHRRLVPERARHSRDGRAGDRRGRDGRDVALDPGVLAALIAEIRLPLRAVPGSLLDKADILDFPGRPRAQGHQRLRPRPSSTRASSSNAIEVYKRGKLTFLFEQYSLDREITALAPLLARAHQARGDPAPVAGRELAVDPARLGDAEGPEGDRAARASSSRSPSST